MVKSTKRRRMYRRKPRATIARLSKAVSLLKRSKEIKEYNYVAGLPFLPLVGNSGFQTIQSLSEIAQGSDINQRVGRELTPISLKISMLLQGSGTSLQVAPQPCRLIILQDMGYVGTLPGGADILDYYSVLAGDNTTALSHYNDDLVARRSAPNNRLRILYDKVFYIHPIYSSYASECSKKLNINIPARRMKKITFAGNTAGSVTNGNIIMYFQHGTNSDSTRQTAMSYRSRLSYYDD